MLNDDENVNVLKWLGWGGYIIALRWMLNWLWDVNWAVMKLGYWWMSNWLWNVHCDCWLVSANDIQNEWSGYDYWLASANGIRDGWLGCVWWLASASDIQNEWLWLWLLISFD